MEYRTGLFELEQLGKVDVERALLSYVRNG